MKIRKLKVNDAQNFIELNKKLDAETQFLLLEPGERQTTLEEQKKRIRNFKSSGVIIFVMENEKELMGFIGGKKGTFLRKKHCLSIAVGILQKYTNKGYGRKLFTKMEEWAKENNIYRLELTVRIDNQIAISLYKKMGFNVEGKKISSLKINDAYYDEYYMSKLI